MVLIIQGTLIGSEISEEVDPDSARMLVIVTQSVTAVRVPPVVLYQITTNTGTMIHSFYKIRNSIAETTIIESIKK